MTGTAADRLEILCAHCRRPSDVETAKGDLTCPWCGATLRATLIEIVHHVSTRVTALPAEPGLEGQTPDDITPVTDPSPLPPVRREPGDAA